MRTYIFDGVIHERKIIFSKIHSPPLSHLEKKTHRIVNVAFNEKQDYFVHCFSLCPSFTCHAFSHLRILYVGFLSPNARRGCRGFLHPFLKHCSFLLFALIAAPPGSQEVGSVPSQPSLAKLPRNQWTIPCCKLSVFVSVFCSMKSSSHTWSNPSFPTGKGYVAIQTEPSSLSEVFISGRSDHTSSGMEYVAGQWTSENLGLLSPGNLVLLSKMSLCFSPVSSGLIDLFSHHYSLQSNF